MPDFFRLFSEYFWAIALAFSGFNYWRATQTIPSTDPSGKVPESRVYLRNFAIAGALPWVIMGAGQIAGATPTVWYYFRPQDGNLFVTAWLSAVFLLSCVFAWWVFFSNGTKKVVEYNLMAALAQSGTKAPSERTVKFFAALGVIMFPVWLYGAAAMNAPLPK